jgi:hypothetical protein
MAAITSVEVANVILKQVASQALARLKANTCMTRLVNRDYEAQLATAGDTITVGIPSLFNVSNLADGNAVLKQNPTMDKTQIVLNQHKYVSFQITDIAELFTPVDVKTTNLGQAVANLAEAIDQSIISAAYAGFTANAPVGAYNSSLTEATILGARETLVKSKAPKASMKCLVVEPGAYTDLLGISRFTELQTRGLADAAGGSSAFGPDGGGANGSAIAFGGVGKLHNFMVFENQMVPITNVNETHNIAFTPDALIFAQRKLPVAPAGMGVIQTFVEEDGMAIRVTMNYNADILGAQITIDTLYGVGIGRNQFGLEVRS